MDGSDKPTHDADGYIAVPSLAKRRAQCTLAGQQTRNKIMRAYGLTEANLTAPPDIQQNWANNMGLNAADWERRCTEERQRHGVPETPETNDAFDAARATILRQYLEAFYLRSVVKKRLTNLTPIPQPAYQGIVPTHALVDVYVNHLTNLAITRFMELGLDERSAYSLTGNLIYTTRLINAQNRLSYASYVMPIQYTNVPVETRMQETRDFWQRRTEDLKRGLASANGPSSPSP